MILVVIRGLRSPEVKSQSRYNRSFTYGVDDRSVPSFSLAGSTSGSALWQTATYTGTTYDFENLVTENVGTSSISLTYDNNDHVNAVSVNGTNNSVTVDAAGNQTLLNTKAYSYSPRNPLASGEGISYSYNALGRRVTASSSAGLQASLYDAFGNLSSESASSSASVMYDYIWFGGKPVAQESLGSGPSTAFTHTNELGAPFLQTSTTGSITWQAELRPVRQYLRPSGRICNRPSTVTASRPGSGNAAWIFKPKWFVTTAL